MNEKKSQKLGEEMLFKVAGGYVEELRDGVPVNENEVISASSGGSCFVSSGGTENTAFVTSGGLQDM